MQVKIPRVFIFLKFLLVLSAIIFVEAESTKNNTKIMEDYSFDDVEFKLEPNNKLFQMSLLNRKKDFEEVIKVIKDMDSDDSRFQTIAILTKSIIGYIQNRTIFVKSSTKKVPNYDLADHFIGDTLYILLENTLYLGDLVVNFPDIVKTILIANHKWIETVFWCFNTIPKMEYLLDKPTIDVIKLAKEKLSFKN